MKTIPSCLCPTTILVVDDDPRYLEAIKLLFKGHQNPYIFTSSAQEALGILNEGVDTSCFVKRWLGTMDAQKAEQHILGVDINQLHKTIFDPNRFKNISTVLIDYDMPMMTGLEFSAQIKNPYVQKIMVTGAADEHLAVTAFNKGLIDGFIRKHEDGFAITVEDAVEKSKINYFNKLMHLAHMAIGLKTGLSPLVDPVFIRMFKDVLEEYSIVEYYQLEASGTFFLMDADGMHYVLFVYSEDRITADLLEITQSIEIDLEPELKEAVLKKQKMLCHYDPAHKAFPDSSQWKSLLKNAKKLIGESTYYYALVPGALKLDKNQVSSYNTYKATLKDSF